MQWAAWLTAFLPHHASVCPPFHPFIVGSIDQACRHSFSFLFCPLCNRVVARLSTPPACNRLAMSHSGQHSSLGTGWCPHCLIELPLFQMQTHMAGCPPTARSQMIAILQSRAAAQAARPPQQPLSRADMLAVLQARQAAEVPSPAQPMSTTYAASHAQPLHYGQPPIHSPQSPVAAHYPQQQQQTINLLPTSPPVQSGPPIVRAAALTPVAPIAIEMSAVSVRGVEGPTHNLSFTSSPPQFSSFPSAASPSSMNSPDSAWRTSFFSSTTPGSPSSSASPSSSSSFVALQSPRSQSAPASPPVKLPMRPRPDYGQQLAGALLWLRQFHRRFGVLLKGLLFPAANVLFGFLFLGSITQGDCVARDVDAVRTQYRVCLWIYGAGSAVVALVALRHFYTMRTNNIHDIDQAMSPLGKRLRRQSKFIKCAAFLFALPLAYVESGVIGEAGWNSNPFTGVKIGLSLLLTFIASFEFTYIASSFLNKRWCKLRQRSGLGYVVAGLGLLWMAAIILCLSVLPLVFEGQAFNPSYTEARQLNTSTLLCFMVETGTAPPFPDSGSDSGWVGNGSVAICNPSLFNTSYFVSTHKAWPPIHIDVPYSNTAQLGAAYDLQLDFQPDAIDLPGESDLITDHQYFVSRWSNLTLLRPGCIHNPTSACATPVYSQYSRPTNEWSGELIRDDPSLFCFLSPGNRTDTGLPSYHSFQDQGTVYRFRVYSQVFATERYRC